MQMQSRIFVCLDDCFVMYESAVETSKAVSNSGSPMSGPLAYAQWNPNGTSLVSPIYFTSTPHHHHDDPNNA